MMNIGMVSLLLAATVAAKDPTPRGCVDCHTREMRLSVMLPKVSAKTVTKVQPLTPKKLTGKHPSVASAMKDIPGKCMTCHSKEMKIAPPFDAMMHVIHLTDNAAFNGDCTACHKFNAVRGTMVIASAPE